MINDSLDSELLWREKHAIEQLSLETNTPITTVQEVFLAEFTRLGVHAHIQSFLPLLGCNSARQLLSEFNANKVSDLKPRNA